MHTNVITIHPDDLVADAAQRMEEYRIRRLPVVDEHECLVGIVTDSDVREAETADSVRSNYEPGVEAEWLTVADVMTPDVVTIDVNASVGELAATLARHKVGGVPVVQASQRFPKQVHLVGIVTETDIFNHIAAAWRAELAPHPQDS
jgi:acetoin utilization protein AcuB